MSVRTERRREQRTLGVKEASIRGVERLKSGEVLSREDRQQLVKLAVVRRVGELLHSGEAQNVIKLIRVGQVDGLNDDSSGIRGHLGEILCRLVLVGAENLQRGLVCLVGVPHLQMHFPHSGVNLAGLFLRGVPLLQTRPKLLQLRQHHVGRLGRQGVVDHRNERIEARGGAVRGEIVQVGETASGWYSN